MKIFIAVFSASICFAQVAKTETKVVMSMLKKFYVSYIMEQTKDGNCDEVVVQGLKNMEQLIPFKRIIAMLWMLLCVAYIVDTHLFVYLSLSQTLVCEFLIAILGICAFLHWIQNTKTKIFISRIQILVLGWITYMIFHSQFIQEAEIYKLLYMVVTLQLLLILPYFIAQRILAIRNIENGLLLVVGLQIACLLLQSLGLVDSYNRLFLLTGFSDNPNVTAVEIAVCLPLLF